MARILSYREYWNMRSDEFQPGDVIEARLVLVLGHGGDYAIYVAPDAEMDAEQIAREGDKLYSDEGMAVGNAVFSVAVHDRYYRR